MSTETGKQIIRSFIHEVWTMGDLDALDRFWTADCVNHAAPPEHAVGLAALRAYHESFAASFTAFSDLQIEVVQQVEEADQVVTQLVTSGQHSGDFAGVPATGRHVVLDTIRIDRLHAGKTAEHWSVADVAGLLQQLQG